MSIFKGTTAPKEIYIWLYGTPMYEYDFTNSSWSVIDDTWSITNQSSTTYDSSYGLFRNYGTSETVLSQSIDLSSLTSRLKITWYARSRSSSGSNAGAVIGLTPNTSSAYDSGIWLHFNGYDLGTGIGTRGGWKRTSSSYNTNETIEATFNFSGGTASGTARGQTASISLSSSDLNTAKTYTGLKICTGTEWIRGIKIEWE